MLVTYPNDVKIYNLSAGKSLPEWLSDRKKRKLVQSDVDVRRRIELIQDFEMPDCSNCVITTKDGQYVYVAGTYKPRVRCYDVNNLSLKFERCMDSEPIKTLVLSDSYEKIVILEEDRWIEFHVQYGRYFRLRIPKFGRDLAFNEASCDLYVVGSGPDAYRLNLEQGRFLAPFSTSASSLTKCDVNLDHNLIMFGTLEGKVEAWDPRAKTCVGTLDCAMNLASESVKLNEMPSVSCLKFKDNLHMAVGTASGQILLYDIRSSRPYVVKDHRCELPIRCVDFCPDQDLVLSMDNRVLKLWYETDDGKPYTSIEPGVDLNDLCLIKGSGLFFMANEGQKVLTYYVPSLGPAPKWCSFLDNITEELEETDRPEVYDDYKFLTPAELDELGLSHLIGSKFLRAYMHGYFIDVRLYNKAKTLVNPFAYKEYRQKKIRERLDNERTNRVQIKKLPQVNRQLAERLMTAETEMDDGSTNEGLAKKKKAKKEKAVAKSLLSDDRFKELFENPEFEIDPESDEFQLLNPSLARLEKHKRQKQQRAAAKIKTDEVNEEEKERSDNDEKEIPDDDVASDSDDKEFYDVRPSSSSEDDQEYIKNVKRAHREVNANQRLRQKEKLDRRLNEANEARNYEIKNADDFQGWGKELTTNGVDVSTKNVSLGSRLATTSTDKNNEQGAVGKEMSFATKQSVRVEEKERKLAEHVRDRRKLRRGAASLKTKQKKFG